jgi:hypothetical protein
MPIDAPSAVAITAAGDLVIGIHNDIAYYHRQPHGHATRT